MSTIGGIILAGGKSRRMGTDKGFVEYNGKPMIRHVLELLNELTEDVMIVANHERYDFLGVRRVEDEVRDQGPLMGIISGLEQTNCEWNWVISCDTPNISRKLLTQLREAGKDADAVWSVYKERVHPLVGLYHKSALPGLRAQWGNGDLKLQLMEQYITIKTCDFSMEDEALFKNINQKEDLC